MRIIVPRAALVGAIAQVKGAVDSKSAVPALANILFRASAPSAALSAGRLTLAATDLYRFASVTIDAEVIEAGDVALPASDVEARVKAIADGPVDLSSDDTFHATIKGVGKARRFDVAGLPGGEFPNIPAPPPDAPSFTMPASALAALIAQTHYAVSSDTTRAHVNSALFELYDGGARMVSTDGHRLAKAEVSRSGEGASPFLIPLAALVELRKLLDGADCDVTVTMAGTSVFVDVDALRFGFKTIDAVFPPYNQVIPHGGTICRVNRAAMIDALRAVSLASSDKIGGVRLGFDATTLRVNADSPETGKGFDEVPCSYAGESFVTGVNAKYVLDALSCIDGDDAEIVVKPSALDPLIVRPVGGVGYLCVVMPMRI